MIGKIFKIKDTVDVYISENNEDDSVNINFHIMTTRDRIEIKAKKMFLTSWLCWMVVEA
ncbi:hypothetical protein [Candidatus Pantoea multigeneris]|uniref:hypothetical protein n=1 Tax=Candidatus Pantoea multigeneris TaxID=2608357 RepID=UPI001F04BE3A|nr:hypothetical protein [Pantoea multigeneris]